MIIDFKSIGFDHYGNVESPTIKLKTLDHKVIGFIANARDISPTFRFNDVSEISFKVPKMLVGTDAPLPFYDRVTGNKLIELEGFGDFYLVKADESTDGIEDYKTCVAYSLEYMFNFKRLYIPEGTYCFYNPASSEDSLMTILMEKLPDWSIGTVAGALIGRYRTFDTVEESLYEFMMNTVQSTYNCLFQFDTLNKKINIIDVNSEVEHLPIYLSLDNLIKDIDIGDLNDEVVTALAGYGADNLTIAEVNPNGGTYVYNLDYFATNGDMEDDLVACWNRYKATIEQYQEVYKTLRTDINNYIAASTVDNAKLVELEYQLKYMRDILSDLAAADFITEDGVKKKFYETQEYKDAIKKRDDTEVAITTQKALIEANKTAYETKLQTLSEITQHCRFRNFFTDEQYARVTSYIREDSITESSFVASNYASLGADTITCTIKETAEEGDINVIEGVSFTIGGEKAQVRLLNDATETITDEELAEAGISDPQKVREAYDNNRNKDIYYITGGVLNLHDESNENVLTGTIEQLSLQINKVNIENWTISEEQANLTDTWKKDYFVITGTIHQAKYNDTEYASVNIVLSGMKKTFGDNLSEDNRTLSMSMKDGQIYLSASLTEHQRQVVAQELYDYTVECLNKLAEPSYEFNISAANYLFSPTFESFKNNTKLGGAVYLNINDEKTISPIIIEASFNYDDPTSLSLTISSKFRSSSSESALADILGQSITTSHSVDLNKYSYTSYNTSGAKNQVKDMIEGALDVAKKNIINSSQQGQEWTESGLYLRQIVDGSYSNEQVAMINNMIAFTDDNWNTVKTALGKIETPQGNSFGLVAESVYGHLLAGNNLVITGENAAGEMEFKVDASGMWAHNGSFMMSGDNTRMFMDPKYGLAFGNQNLYTVDENDPTKIVPSFIDENGNLIFDDAQISLGSSNYSGQAPINTNLYLDAKTGKAFFRGNIYAENGYFSGTVNATSGKFVGEIEATSGKFSNTVDASALSIAGQQVSLANSNFALDDILSYDSATGKIKLNANVTISYSGSVTDKPYIPSVPSNIMTYDTTEVGYNYVLTKTLKANNLTIAGGQIDMTSSNATDSSMGNSKIILKGTSYGLYLYPNEVRISDGTSQNINYGIRIRPGKIYAGGKVLFNQIDTESMSTQTWSSQLFVCKGEQVSSASQADSASTVYVSSSDTTEYSVRVKSSGSSKTLHAHALGSLRKWKKDIKPIESGIVDPHKLYDIEVVQFKYNDEFFKGEEDGKLIINKKDWRYDKTLCGFIVDDLEKIYPNCVERNGNGEGFNWDPQYILPSMLKLIQEQNDRLKVLESKINELEKA